MTAKRVDALLDLLAEHLVELVYLRKQLGMLQVFRDQLADYPTEEHQNQWIVAGLDEVLIGRGL